MKNRVSILGVPVDCVTLTEARDRVLAMSASGAHHVMTPNPEMLTEASRNPDFKTLLQSSDLNIPDGAGLLWAARRAGHALPERVTGIDLVSAVAGNPTCPPVFLLGAAQGIAEAAADHLRKNNPSLHIAGTFSGSPHVDQEAAIISMINASGASILFVAYGAPKQDMWIRRNLPKMPSVHVAMGVGGAFDFLAGKRKRAPQLLRSFGLEWLWRLMQEPTRIGRIFTAVAVFPYLVLTQSQSVRS